jgi:hypothetical protein
MRAIVMFPQPCLPFALTLCFRVALLQGINSELATVSRGPSIAREA